tara:strand:- start:2 stop:613 length:612 start_codon:yes stop_codon:yes gene_type:complete
MIRWNKKEMRLITKYYPLYGATGPKGCVKRIAKLGNARSRKSVSLKAFVMGVKYLGDVKGYKKGSIPMNKGKKMSAELYAKCSRTYFQKGRLPHNTKSELSLSHRKDKFGKYYWFIRISKAVWKPLHRIIYENVHGVKLGKEDCIRFRDGDTNNIHPDNLVYLTVQDNMNMNNPYLHYPAEVVKVIKLNNKLKRKINAKKQNK